MFCYKCGRELKEGSRFCGYCGTKLQGISEKKQGNDEQLSQNEFESEPHNLQLPEQETDEKKIEEEISLKKNVNKKNLLIIAEVVSLFICFGIIAAVTRKNDSITASRDTEEIQKNIMEELEETKKEGIENEAIKFENDTEGSEEEDLYQLLVSVPAESMALRSSPGLGEDVILELKAGTYLKWYGETATEEDREFYKVVVIDSGQEGYVSAEFCVEIDFELDESILTIVETDTALYTYEMMTEDIQDLCTQYPEYLSYNVLGTSWDGRDIYEMVLGNPDAENHIMMHAGIHGREYMTVQLVMKMIEYYAVNYETASFHQIPYKDLLNQTAFHIVPMANPDGVTISQLGVDALNDPRFADFIYECYERDKWTLVYEEDSNGDMNWGEHYLDEDFDREALGLGYDQIISFEEYQTIWKANAGGVDLNNNFDAGWDEIDLKEYPAYGSFKGDSPVSEPESKALEQLALKYDYKYFISYHTRGQLIYYDVSGNMPENSAASEGFANLMSEWIKYKPINTNVGYNVNLGGFGDWVQLSLNKPSITIESGKKPSPLTIDEFPAIWYRHRESWAMLAEQLYN